MNTSTLVQKVWNFCHTLRDDGVGYGDYLEQLTYLLFLKLAHEYAQPPYNRNTHIPKSCDWSSLRRKTGEPLEAHYLTILHKLGQEPGMLGAIFFKAQNKIQDPAKLARLVQMIDAENWISLGSDTKGDLYEGLLQKNAEDTKSGAGQYFTPRALIDAMVTCVQPQPMKTIADPACGTGGFFLGAYNWLTRPGSNLNKRERAFLRDKTFHGNEIVPGTRRMCLMNLFLHNIGELDGEPLVDRSDALIGDTGKRFDYVLANPPFGKKSSMTITNEEGEEDRDALTYERQDFWETTSNKQLNFLQHIVTILKADGKAAVSIAGQCAVRRWRGRKDPPQVIGNLRSAHCPAPSHRYLLCEWRQSQRGVLRRQTERWQGPYQRHLVLRSAHQQAFHSEDAIPQA
jgi:type I restriction enzyme M protein